MKHLKIAFSHKAQFYFGSMEGRTNVELSQTDFTDVGAIVISESDTDVLENELVQSFGIPVFLVVFDKSVDISPFIGKVERVIDGSTTNFDLYKRQIEAAAAKYEASMLPPFFQALANYVEDGNSQFDCPGHQGGQFFCKHPAGRAFYDFFGENVFRADLCNADVKLGDLLIHEGSAVEAQQHAAQVYNADKTYFVLNGKSSSNKVVLNS